MKGWFLLLRLLAGRVLPPASPPQNGKAGHLPPQATSDRVEPPDRPSRPRGTAPDTIPSVSGKLSPPGPALAEWTRSADPGDLVVFSGHDLTALRGKDAGGDAEVLVMEQAGPSSQDPARAETLRAYEEGMAVRPPPSPPPGGMIFLWVRHTTGLSRPAAIERTEAWRLGPDNVMRRDTVSLFSWIDLKPATGGGIERRPSTAHPYKIDFTIPARFPNDEDAAWAPHGRGGVAGGGGAKPHGGPLAGLPQWLHLARPVRHHLSGGLLERHRHFHDPPPRVGRRPHDPHGLGGSARFFVCMSHRGPNRPPYIEGNVPVELGVRNGNALKSGGRFLRETGAKVHGVFLPATPTTITSGGELSRRREGDEAALVEEKDPGRNRRIAAVEKRGLGEPACRGRDSTRVLGAISHKNVFLDIPTTVATEGGRGNPGAGHLNVFGRHMTERGRVWCGWIEEVRDDGIRERPGRRRANPVGGLAGGAGGHRGGGG